MSSDGLDLRIEDLTVVYGGVTALDNVNITVPPGGFVTVLGANGAGKTTLVRSITSLLYLHKGRVRRGSITLGGESILGKKSPDIVKAGVAQVPEGRKLFPNLTVKENLLCGAASRSDVSGIDESLEQNLELFTQLRPLLNQTAGLLFGEASSRWWRWVGPSCRSRPCSSAMSCHWGWRPRLSTGFSSCSARSTRRGEPRSWSSSKMPVWRSSTAADAYVLELGRVLMEGSAAELRGNPMVQELYLGGGGEAHTSYAAIERPGAAES